jgi:hypothetical protein
MNNPPDLIHDKINAMLNNSRGWDTVYLERDTVRLGGIIVVRDPDIFDKVVAVINEHCKTEVKG